MHHQQNCTLLLGSRVAHKDLKKLLNKVGFFHPQGQPETSPKSGRSPGLQALQLYIPLRQTQTVQFVTEEIPQKHFFRDDKPQGETPPPPKEEKREPKKNQMFVGPSGQNNTVTQKRQKIVQKRGGGGGTAAPRLQSRPTTQGRTVPQQGSVTGRRDQKSTTS
jgi:hypothetical protein